MQALELMINDKEIYFINIYVQIMMTAFFSNN